jgi:hypothetical protein
VGLFPALDLLQHSEISSRIPPNRASDPKALFQRMPKGAQNLVSIVEAILFIECSEIVDFNVDADEIRASQIIL